MRRRCPQCGEKKEWIDFRTDVEICRECETDNRLWIPDPEERELYRD